MNRLLLTGLFLASTHVLAGCAAEASDDSAPSEESEVKGKPSATKALSALVAKADKIVLTRGFGGPASLSSLFGENDTIEIAGEDLALAANALGLTSGASFDAKKAPPTSRCPSPLSIAIEQKGKALLDIPLQCDGSRLETAIYLKAGKLSAQSDGATEGLLLLGSLQRLSRVVHHEPIRMRDALDPVETASLVGEDGKGTAIDAIKTYYALGSQDAGDSQAIKIGVSSRCLPGAEVAFAGKSALLPDLAPEIVRVRICDDFKSATLFAPNGEVIGLLGKLSDPKALQATLATAD